METGGADLHKGRTHEEKGVATESWCMSKVVGEEELAKTQILIWEALGRWLNAVNESTERQ